MTFKLNETELQERIVKAAMRGVIRATEMVREEAISLILHTSKTGRVYRTRGVVHQASAPGEAPASDTGRLVNSIYTEYEPESLTGYVGVNVAYGLMLEFGTQKMEPRPYLRPALANKMPEAEQIIEDEIAKELAKTSPTP